MTSAASLSLLGALLTPDGVGNIALDANPPQFDNSLKVATTAFVQGLGLHFPVHAGLGINASVSLTPAQMNGWGQIQAAGIVVTLPPLTSVPAGETFTFQASQNATIKGSGTDPILNPAGGSGNGIAVRQGETLTLVANGTGGNWYAILDGFGLAAFPSSFSGLGYQKLPSGLFIQWGFSTTTGTGVGDVLTLPIAFPNGFLGGTIIDGGNGIHSCAITAGSTTTITCYGGIPQPSGPEYASTSYRYLVVGF